MPETIVESPQRLARFSQWLQDNDEHAAHHQQMLAGSIEALTAVGDPEVAKQQSMADDIERCRYQLLKKLAGQLSDTDQEMVDELDLLSNRLAGRSPRRPRAPRLALRSVSTGDCGDGLTTDEIQRCLDPSTGLEELVRRARELTAQRFATVSSDTPVRVGAPPRDGTAAGQRTMVLYAPLYLSSYCINYCSYCGFRFSENVEREHLSETQALQQAEILAERGFRHLLLVAGDFPKLTSTNYFADIVRGLSEREFSVAVEIAPLSTADYAQLVEAGACGVTLYQETYDEHRYGNYHWRGTKASYDWRLEAHERAAEAGMSRLGLGVLLGLSDPRTDVLSLIRHGRYLRSRFPQLRIAFGLPRIHEAPSDFKPPFRVDDDLFVRLYCVLRLAFPTAHLVLSTRESERLRSQLASTCITQMSAGSSTAPGGYESDGDMSDQKDRQQFPIADDRSPAEVARWLRDNRFAVRWDVE